jgi:hypothetical protein
VLTTILFKHLFLSVFHRGKEFAGLLARDCARQIGRAPQGPQVFARMATRVHQQRYCPARDLYRGVIWLTREHGQKVV